jgi:ComF family protein
MELGVPLLNLHGRNRMHSHLARIGKTFSHGLLQIVYPATCLACGGSPEQYQDRLCSSCRHLLANLNTQVCPRCAATVGPYVELEDGCTHCRKLSFPFERVLRLGPYSGALREAVLRTKHLAGEDLAEALGQLWADVSFKEFQALGVQAVVPVPLHWFKRWKRGYNQSEALAQPLAAKLGLPCLKRCLRRTRYTSQQTQPSVVNRLSNVHNAFKARIPGKLRKKSLLLVDDVFTSGSTASEAAKALKRGGAGKIIVAVLARAEP